MSPSAASRHGVALPVPASPISQTLALGVRPTEGTGIACVLVEMSREDARGYLALMDQVTALEASDARVNSVMLRDRHPRGLRFRGWQSQTRSVIGAAPASVVLTPVDALMSLTSDAAPVIVTPALLPAVLGFLEERNTSSSMAVVTGDAVTWTVFEKHCPAGAVTAPVSRALLAQLADGVAA